MPGTNSGVNVSDPAVVAAFEVALVHQGLIALLIFAVLGLAWVSIRAWLPAGLGNAAGAAEASASATAEPARRRLRRIGFGVLWVFDEILQAQPKMAIGLPSQVIEPITTSSPRWVQHLVNVDGTWSYHPLQAGASAVWTRSGSACGCWWRRVARCPGSPDWPASAGAWWSGCSAKPSAASSPRV
jgi:hypothetical protein